MVCATKAVKVLAWTTICCVSLHLFVVPVNAFVSRPEPQSQQRILSLSLPHRSKVGASVPLRNMVLQLHDKVNLGSDGGTFDKSLQFGETPIPLETNSNDVVGEADSNDLPTSSTAATTAATSSASTALSPAPAQPAAIPVIAIDDALITPKKNEEFINELLLENISRQSPDQIFASSLSEDDPTVAAPAPALETQSSTGVANVTSSATASTGEVQAILAASGQAAAVAEASMPRDLAEELDWAAPDVVFAGSNAANASLPLVSDRKTPVVTDSVEEILSAASVVGEPVTATQTIEAPEVMKILKFAIPAIGVWLCGPLLSLIDTSAVGIFSGTTQQAALNPAVAVTDYAALLIAFMYTGATNLVAAAQESDRGDPEKPKTSKTLIGAIQMSTFVGTGLGAILFAFANPLLKAIIGNDAISPAVFAAAMRYVRIRALGMPAAAIIGSTQAACLGMQDIKSPLYVLVAAAVVNFLGDMFLVGNSNPWIGGASGAAWATILSQYVGVAFFINWLTHKSSKADRPRVVNLSKAILELTSNATTEESNQRQQQLQNDLQSFGTRSDGRKQSLRERVRVLSGKIKITGSKNTDKKKGKVVAPKREEFSVRGFLADRFKTSDLLRPPSADTRKEFAPYLVPVTATQVGRVSGYVAMSHVVASSLGTVSMAAQQVIVSLFYCLCPIADSLSLTAQSFLPSISEKPPSTQRTLALRKTALNFIKAGVVFGASLVSAVSMIPLISGMFTTDPAVVSLVNSVVPFLMAFFTVHGTVCSAEGILLGCKDLGFLGKMYGFFFAAVPYLMLRVKKAALTGTRAVGLTSVWRVFVGYQLFRCAAWLSRVAILQRKFAKSEVTQSIEDSSERADILTP